MVMSLVNFAHELVCYGYVTNLFVMYLLWSLTLFLWICAESMNICVVLNVMNVVLNAQVFIYVLN